MEGGVLTNDTRTDASDAEREERRAMMGLLARATGAELAAGLARLGPPADVEDLRPPEVGLVMLRGRMGGTGAAFNLGEATVVRAVVRLSSGEVGTAYALGRDRAKARLAAVVDALWARPDRRAAIETGLLEPIRRRLAGEAARESSETAATRVDFFTMVRGENATP